MAADSDQEQDRGQEHGVADVLVGGAAGVGALAKSSSACASAALAAAASGITYWGMYEGPGGALGLCAGSVASHALKAGR